jgi:hypothetical protein
MGRTDRKTGKTERQELNPGNSEWDQHDHCDNQSFPRSDPNSEAPVWRKMNNPMSFAKNSHDTDKRKLIARYLAIRSILENLSPATGVLRGILQCLYPFPFHARSASSWVSRFGPLAWQFGHTPENPPRLLRITPFACLQNGQRRGFGIPRQFLYSRYSYPVGAMPDPFSFGKEFRNAVIRSGFSGRHSP